MHFCESRQAQLPGRLITIAGHGRSALLRVWLRSSDGWLYHAKYMNSGHPPATTHLSPRAIPRAKKRDQTRHHLITSKRRGLRT